jgi:putative nucleotidyltransferase with HDIG domain
MRRFERSDAARNNGAGPGLPEFISLLKERDPELSEHSHRVADDAERIARALGLPAPAIGRVRVAAYLHDLGKVWISRDILDKPGPLDEREWLEVKRHPRTAARLLQFAELHELADIVVAHHERPDGTGYPDAVPSAEVAIESQIVAVADTYDAMLSPRPYAPTLSPNEARLELERVASRQLDARVVQAFLDVLDGRHAVV